MLSFSWLIRFNIGICLIEFSWKDMEQFCALAYESRRRNEKSYPKVARQALFLIQHNQRGFRSNWWSRRRPNGTKKSGGLFIVRSGLERWQKRSWRNKKATRRWLFVEPGRIELPSKQAMTMLSTCLVFVWLSARNWPKTAHYALSFFRFMRLSKQEPHYVDFYGAPGWVAVNKGYPGAFSFPALRD